MQENQAVNSIIQARKLECELDFLYFSRYFFKQRFGTKMIISGHHLVMVKFLRDIITGKIKRGIINIPPGYTKTDFAVINLIAYGLACNPRARFLHLSYSHALALLNSATTKGLVESFRYQEMWPVALKEDAKAKEIWWTEQNGGVRATSSMGQVTGFRAGHMDHTDDNFTGALIIDDPVKPEDAYSEVMREGVNNNFNETIASRVAVENVPILVIMQRIHFNDLSGYLLKGGSGEKWHHLNLPVILDKAETYPEEYTHGIPYAHDLPDGWLWPFKHNDEHSMALKSHRRKFWAQYMQNPIKRDEETALWSESMINQARAVEIEARIIRTVVAVDPAVSNTATSDEHGIGVVSEYADKKYSVDADYSLKGSPKTWADRAIAAHDKHEALGIVVEINQGGDMCRDTLRNAGFRGKIIMVRASKGKTARAEPIAALYELGLISHGTGLLKLEEEMMDFDPITQKSNGKSPNRVDWLVWALTELAIPATKIHIG